MIASAIGRLFSASLTLAGLLLGIIESVAAGYLDPLVGGGSRDLVVAAVLMLSLNEEDAAQIFRHLEPKQVQRLGMSMASMSDFSHDRVAAVHRQFIDDIQKYTNIGIGSEDFVRKALVAALGEDKASNLVDQIILGSGARGLDSLKWMDARQVASIIQNEHPQIQTIVLSYLEPEQSAEILSQFPEQVRLDLVMRIANLEEVQPAALQELNDIMEKTVGRAASSQQLITEVGQDIDKLSSHSDAVLEMSTQIATSSEEQSSVAEEITRNLDKVRHEASRVEESASAAVAGTTGLKGTASELGQALTGLRI